MTITHRLVLLLAIACAGLIVMIGVARLAKARTDDGRAVARFHAVRGDAEIVQRLRAQEERISLHARPTEDMIALVNRALIQAGLPPDRLADLRSDSDAALPAIAGAPMYRRQSIAFSLRSMTPGDLGVFLAAWNDARTVWNMTRITLTAPRGRAGADEGRFDVAFTVSAIYLGEE